MILFENGTFTISYSRFICSIFVMKQLNVCLMLHQYKVVLKALKGYRFYKLVDIIYFKACDKYAEIVLAGGTVEMVFTSLSALEKLLQVDRIGREIPFIRIHRQYIVNVWYAKQWPTWNCLVLEDSQVLPVSRTGLIRLRAHIQSSFSQQVSQLSFP